MNYKDVDYKKLGNGTLPEHLGIEIIEVTSGKASAKMEIKKLHYAPNGYLHAGSVVSLADSIAGYGCLYNLPENGKSFTTIELKSNFIGTAKSGYIIAKATLKHAGRTTQIWDVIVSNEQTNKTIALFRCTQLVLY